MYKHLNKEFHHVTTLEFGISSCSNILIQYLVMNKHFYIAFYDEQTFEYGISSCTYIEYGI